MLECAMVTETTEKRSSLDLQTQALSEQAGEVRTQAWPGEVFLTLAELERNDGLDQNALPQEKGLMFGSEGIFMQTADVQKLMEKAETAQSAARIVLAQYMNSVGLLVEARQFAARMSEFQQLEGASNFFGISPQDIRSQYEALSPLIDQAISLLRDDSLSSKIAEKIPLVKAAAEYYGL